MPISNNEARALSNRKPSGWNQQNCDNAVEYLLSRGWTLPKNYPSSTRFLKILPYPRRKLAPNETYIDNARIKDPATGFCIGVQKALQRAARSERSNNDLKVMVGVALNALIIGNPARAKEVLEQVYVKVGGTIG